MSTLEEWDERSCGTMIPPVELTFVYDVMGLMLAWFLIFGVELGSFRRNWVVEGCHEEADVVMNAYPRGMEGAAMRAFVYSLSMSWSV